jgi:hypothetical protein
MEQVKNLFSRANQNPNERIQLGKVSGSLWRKEELTEGQLNHHVHIVGASGYGKTVLISHIIKQRIQNGKGLMFIDLKADMDTLLKFSQHVVQADRINDLRIFSLTEKDMSLPYNLIQDGTATQLRDRIVNSLNWSEEYYKNQSSSFLLKLLILLCWLRDNQEKSFHLGTILDCASNVKKLVEIGNLIPTNETKLKGYAQGLKEFESAEMISGIAGTRTVWKHTMQTERFGFFNVESGGGSKREVEEYVIHPNLVKSLRVGKCVCIKKYPESRAYLVDVNAN